MVGLCALLWSRQASQIRRLLAGSHGMYSFVVTVGSVAVAGMVCSRVYCRDLVLRLRLLVVEVALIAHRVLLYSFVVVSQSVADTCVSHSRGCWRPATMDRPCVRRVSTGVR